jgi:hypothetical protein
MEIILVTRHVIQNVLHAVEIANMRLLSYGHVIQLHIALILIIYRKSQTKSKIGLLLPERHLAVRIIAAKWKFDDAHSDGTLSCYLHFFIFFLSTIFKEGCGLSELLSNNRLSYVIMTNK